jgi:hypothetical protein
MLNASTPDQVRGHLIELIDSGDHRENVGRRLRDWLVRNHGEQKTVPAMLALLQMAADRTRLWRWADNPLREPLTAAERDYHQHCLQ